MKLYILSGAILLLMAGVTLVGNSLEVTGQSDMEKALEAASNAATNATQTAMNNILSNVSNNVTNTGLNTSSNLTEPINATTNRQLNKTSQTYTYDNATLGISFQYPSNWDLIEKQNRFSWIDAKLEFGNSWITFDVQEDPLTDINDDNALLDSIEAGVRSNYDATVFEKAMDKYFINNQTAPYVIGTFTKPDLFGNSYDFVTMYIIVKLTGDKILLVQYAANQDDFDKFLPKVEKVLESIKTEGSISAVEAR